MRRVLELAKGLPVCVRLLDVGADKSLPFMESLNEANPALGRRGIRFLLKYPDLLQTQLDALLQLSSQFDLSILVPMVTLPPRHEERQGTLDRDCATVARLVCPNWEPSLRHRQLLLALARLLNMPTSKLRHKRSYTVYVSRLTGRMRPYAYFDDTHDVIFRLLKTAHDDAPDVPLSLCGELAGRPNAHRGTCGAASLH